MSERQTTLWTTQDVMECTQFYRCGKNGAFCHMCVPIRSHSFKRSIADLATSDLFKSILVQWSLASHNCPSMDRLSHVILLMYLRLATCKCLPGRNNNKKITSILLYARKKRTSLKCFCCFCWALTVGGGGTWRSGVGVGVLFHMTLLQIVQRGRHR